MLSGPPTGYLRLRAVAHGGRTTLAEVARSAPLHPGPASYRAGDGTAEVIVQQAGPGLFPGERLLTQIVVEADAHLIVRGQGATELHPSPNGIPAETVTVLRVASGGTLIYLPGELIPFRDAVVRQETTAELAPEARFALAESVTPGRLAMSEREAFSRLDLRLRSSLDGPPALIERSLLEPRLRPLRALGRHGEHACAGSLYLAGWPPCLARPGTVPVEDGVWRGSGETGDGALTVVRLLRPTAQAVHRQIEAALIAAGPAGWSPISVSGSSRS